LIIFTSNVLGNSNYHTLLVGVAFSSKILTKIMAIPCGVIDKLLGKRA